MENKHKINFNILNLEVLIILVVKYKHIIWYIWYYINGIEKTHV
jgi:hypothetical protein